LVLITKSRDGVSELGRADMNSKLSVLVTGSGGFLGRHTVRYLAALGYKVIAASRTASDSGNPNIVTVQLPELSKPFDWQPLLEGCDAVVHLAGLAHKPANEEQYDLVNHRATAALARAAAGVGTNHLVFVSSIAAQSGPYSDHKLREDDPPRPNNAYGRSKLAAENAIRTTGISFTILRPVVIYGEGEKGNVATVHRIARLPIPLPFGGVTARRSVLSIQNLNSAVEIALTDPRARGETFIVSNPAPVTIADLIAGYRMSIGRSAWLVPIPERWLELFFEIIGQRPVWERVGCPLIADPSKLMAIGWNPLEPSSTLPGSDLTM
jgi:nucleoside-diphosphate-sugar epimerase